VKFVLVSIRFNTGVCNLNIKSTSKTTKGNKKYSPPSKLKKLLENSAWYKTIIESMADGIVATDMNGFIAYVNPKLCKMLRYEKEELLGKVSIAIVSEEDRNRVTSETEMRYNEKTSSQYEVTMRTKFGSPVPVMISATPILGMEGETIGTYALVTDIKDRKLVEVELRNKNNELLSLYNNLLELYEQLGAIIAESTQIHTEIFLFTSKDCVYCAPAEEVLQEVLAAYGGKITYRKVDIEEEPEFSDQFDIMSLPTIIIGEEKLTAVPDVYKLHSALFSALVPKEKFRRTRQELDNIINYSPIAIFTLNSEGILTSANPLLEMMIGMKKDVIVGTNILKPANKVKIFPKDLVKLLKKGLTGENVSVNRIRVKDLDEKNPEPFTIISFKAVPMTNTEGEVTEILVLSEDVTTLAIQEEQLSDSFVKMEELNDKLIQMSKDRSNFVDVTTTKLLEPLKNSKSLLDQILSGQLGELNDETFGTIEFLRNTLVNVSKSILDILDFFNLELQGYTLKLDQYQIDDLISEVMKDLGSIVIDRGFILIPEIPDNISAYCDNELTVRALKNLILNSIKFTEKECRIVITAKKIKKSFIEIAVKDNGVGIAKEDLGRVFEQYVKVNPSSSGSGLGLTVVKSLIEAHHGTVKAESEGENKGSTFTITLPYNKKAFKKLASKSD